MRDPGDCGSWRCTVDGSRLAALMMELTCLVIEKSLSSQAPRFRTEVVGLRTEPPNVMAMFCWNEKIMSFAFNQRFIEIERVLHSALSQSSYIMMLRSNISCSCNLHVSRSERGRVHCHGYKSHACRAKMHRTAPRF